MFLAHKCLIFYMKYVLSLYGHKFDFVQNPNERKYSYDNYAPYNVKSPDDSRTFHGILMSI